MAAKPAPTIRMRFMVGDLLLDWSTRRSWCARLHVPIRDASVASSRRLERALCDTGYLLHLPEREQDTARQFLVDLPATACAWSIAPPEPQTSSASCTASASVIDRPSFHARSNA